MTATTTGPVEATKDPQLSEWGRQGAKARHSVDTYIASIAAKAPELTTEQRTRLAAILAVPTTPKQDGGVEDDA